MSVSSNPQSGMALLVSLVFLLLLSVIGLASIGSAGQQEKMAGSVQRANHSFQAAETALRRGESWLQREWFAVFACISPATCSPPAEARTQLSPGIDPVSGVRWIQVTDGLYGIQNLGPSLPPVHLPVKTSTRLYRITGIGVRGQSRTVLESIYVRYEQGAEEAARQHFRRIMWRQIQ